MYHLLTTAHCMWRHCRPYSRCGFWIITSLLYCATSSKISDQRMTLDMSKKVFIVSSFKPLFITDVRKESLRNTTSVEATDQSSWQSWLKYFHVWYLCSGCHCIFITTTTAYKFCESRSIVFNCSLFPLFFTMEMLNHSSVRFMCLLPFENINSCLGKAVTSLSMFSTKLLIKRSCYLLLAALLRPHCCDLVPLWLLFGLCFIFSN